jgi:hypothetical protein
VFESTDRKMSEGKSNEKGGSVLRKDRPPGILQLEVIVTDHLGQVSAERIWDNIPDTPTPNPEEITPPKFPEILRLREEFGLDPDIKGNENGLHERIFNLIATWHNPKTPDGEVARASMDRWGVPLRPSDVAEMECRAAYIAADRQLLEEWVTTTGHTSSYAGYYVDHRAGGVFPVASPPDRLRPAPNSRQPLIRSRQIDSNHFPRRRPPPPKSSRRTMKRLLSPSLRTEIWPP